MNLLDELSERTDGRGVKECGVHYALRILDPAVAEKFRTVLAMSLSAVKSSEISAALEEYGVSVGNDSVSRHRRGKCVTCGKST